MCPIPELKNNEKFAYFYRPYNYNIHTRKFMNFDGLKDENDETPKQETPRTFDYVLLKEKIIRQREKLKKIEEAEQ